ncbi:pilus assembly protein [Variovorax sp. PBL-E5]|uniref:pilus assembly protein n=1 Tax=Variovorax sp. PBL-E5 TaxID=434014 RepID=UPI001318F9DF|nr:PilC/PilY family type IV pilus protein [Variovorax sp. PBL-E5]VTU22825.1 Tfp pilus assembly protein, tip-associated adhesin PilY1 [Variovorax sp. PBL-E5]
MKTMRRVRSWVPGIRWWGIPLAVLLSMGGGLLEAMASNPTLLISQVPLALTTPGRPQVVFALANSSSMDGILSGAIMTGSGMRSIPIYADYGLVFPIDELGGSSSPVNYAVPAGFTPPRQPADSTGMAPYTAVDAQGWPVDNGPSRLNVAKAGIMATLQSYLQNTDFGLMDYQSEADGVYLTYAYYMSPDTGGFVYTNTQEPGKRYITNPCANYKSSATTLVGTTCDSIANSGLVDSATLSGSAYVQIGASSDDPNINDVYYLGTGLAPVFYKYGEPTPKSPYPPYFKLSDFNARRTLISYPNTAPAGQPNTSVPSNAGYAAYSSQILYAQRGFGFSKYASPGDGHVVVDMTKLGANPAATDVTAALNTFLPSLQSESMDIDAPDIKSVASQSPIAGLLTGVKSYFGRVAPNSVGGCAPQQYVVLLSDGLPTMDLSGGAWPPLGSAAAAGFGITANFNDDGSLASTNNQAVHDAIESTKALRSVGIKTYVVGLGAGVDPTLNPQAAATLKAIAVAGGTANYYPATSPAALVDDLNGILVAVQNAAASLTASSVNSSHLQSGSVEYQANLVSSDTPYQDWTGDLFAKALDPATGAPTGGPIWSARTLLDAQAAGTGWSSSRLIATWNPVLNAGVPFEWPGSAASSGISPAQQSLLQPSDTAGQSRLAYLRGDTSGEARNGGTFRNRSHLLGDIVDSQAAYVGAPNGTYFSTSYFTFQSRHANRAPMLYVGANDGMLHGINASNGSEQFAFVPNGVFSNLYQLSAPFYNQSHLFFVDGSPQSGDVQFSDGSWHTMLVGGENGGGRTVYALDVTDPSTLTSETAVANAVKWEFSDSDMGLSYSQPTIAAIAASPNYAVFFGNGYNSPSNHAILFAVNPQTGETIAKIDLCSASGVPSNACSATAPEGLSTVSVANSDGLQSAAITKVYAGDLQGNLWAIDVSSATPSAWSVKLLFQARDAAGAAQPITTAPVVTLNPQYPHIAGLFVMFGTGQFLTASDLSGTQVQSVYGILDSPTGSGYPYQRSNLQSQTLTLVTAAQSGLPQDILTATNSRVDFSSKVGWHDDLPIAGQRVMTDPQLLNGAFITTLNTPPSTSCGIRAAPVLLELNYATGGAFSQPQLDVNGNLVIDLNDAYNGSNPVGVGLGTAGYGSSPTILGPNKSNQMVKNITLSNGTQPSILNPNNNTHSIAWWQIQ